MYDMDELEIQRKVMESIESKELKEEKAKWHKKYNEAEIEISHLKREVDSLISAVKTLIKERDCAIADIKTIFNDGECEVCCCGDVDCIEYGGGCKWRGVKK